MTTLSPTTTRALPSSPLDDPVDFAPELYNKLWSGFGSADLPIDNALAIAMEPFDQTKDQISTLLTDHPEAPAIRRHLDRLTEVCLSVAHEQHDLGTEFGIASEQLRQTLRSGANGPRKRSWLNG